MEVSLQTLEKTTTIQIVSPMTESINTAMKNKKKYEDDPSIIETTVKNINKINDGLVEDYDYEVIDEKNIIVTIVFKHLMKKLGETQKFWHGKVVIGENIATLTTINKKPSLKISSKVELIPIVSITITTNLDDPSLIKSEIIMNTLENETEYKNFNMCMMLIKNSLTKVYSELDLFI